MVIRLGEAIKRALDDGTRIQFASKLLVRRLLRGPGRNAIATHGRLCCRASRTTRSSI